MDSLECDCCFAVGVLYMMGERTPGVDSLECDCCFAVGVLYMMGERLAWMQQSKDTFTVSYGYIDIKCRWWDSKFAVGLASCSETSKWHGLKHYINRSYKL